MKGWQAAARCRDEDPELFFRDDAASVEAAKAVCARCPVAGECRDAGRNEPWGVWGAQGPDDRFGLLLATPEPPEPVHSYPACKCGRCREAHAARLAEWRARDRPAAATPRGTVDQAEQLELGVA